MSFRHRNNGLTTMNTRRAKGREEYMVGIREVDDIGLSTDYSFRFPGNSCISCLLCARHHAKYFHILDLI
jgi:hypothetical protein